MRFAIATLLWTALAVGTVPAQEPAPVPPAATPEAERQNPIGVGVTEETEVRLILVDVVVVDADGRTVSDLTVNDFQVVSRGQAAPIDTLASKPLEQLTTDRASWTQAPWLF